MTARLVGYPGGFDLGPADTAEWLAGYLWKEPTDNQRRKVKDLAERIDSKQKEALACLRPNDVNPFDGGEHHSKWDYRNRSICHSFNPLGTHTAAARYAFRRAAVSIWETKLINGNKIAKKQHRNHLKSLIEATDKLTKALNILTPAERLLFAHSSTLGDVWSPLLALDSMGQDPAPLVDYLHETNEEAKRLLRAIGEPSQGHGKPFFVGQGACKDNFAVQLFGTVDTIDFAVEVAFQAYTHFRQDRASGTIGGPFVFFADLLVELGLGETRSTRKHIDKFLSKARDEPDPYYDPSA
jgi:hypothetical protein